MNNSLRLKLDAWQFPVRLFSAKEKFVKTTEHSRLIILDQSRSWNHLKYIVFVLSQFPTKKMVKVISQETFDGVVQENIEEFGLDKEEAIKDAISQFESQVW